MHSGTATLKDATSEAIRDWVTNVESTHYILGSAAGPHPYPMMVGGAGGRAGRGRRAGVGAWEHHASREVLAVRWPVPLKMSSFCKGYTSPHCAQLYAIFIACPASPARPQVRDFQAIIGREVRAQAAEKWGGKPDVLVACIGGGSNAIGLFHEFVDDADVRMIGVEAGERGGEGRGAGVAAYAGAG